MISEIDFHGLRMIDFELKRGDPRARDIGGTLTRVKMAVKRPDDTKTRIEVTLPAALSDIDFARAISAACERVMNKYKGADR